MVSEEQKEGKGRRRREGKSEGIYKIKEAGNGDGNGVGKAREEGRVGNLPPSSSCGHSPSCAPKFLCDTPSGFRLPFLKARSSARLVVGGGCLSRVEAFNILSLYPTTLATNAHYLRCLVCRVVQHPLLQIAHRLPVDVLHRLGKHPKRLQCCRQA